MNGSPANRAWLWMIDAIFLEGAPVHPREGRPGAGLTLELLNYSSVIRMDCPCVTVLDRKLSTKFMAAEAAWILSGDDRVETIARYAPSIRKFSDGGETFFGAYGPRIQSQLSYVVEALRADHQTRQAVMTIWRPTPPRSNDIPCTISAQWLIRDGVLHCVDNMRSSDAWLGWPYDVFNFSMLSAVILLLLRKQGVEYELGSLFLNAGSQHLYDRNVVAARRCGESSWGKELPVFDWREFESPTHLLSYLWRIADGEELEDHDPKWLL